MARFRSDVRRIDGGLRVRLRPEERDLLAMLATDLRGVLVGDVGSDQLQARLFPPAYADADKEAEYHLTRGSELAHRRSETLDRFVDSMAQGAPQRSGWSVDLDWDAAHAWLQVVNDARLVLSTAEGITTEADWDVEPETPQRMVLHWLGWFEEQLVVALMSTLDD